AVTQVQLATGGETGQGADGVRQAAQRDGCGAAGQGDGRKGRAIGLNDRPAGQDVDQRHGGQVGAGVDGDATRGDGAVMAAQHQFAGVQNEIGEQQAQRASAAGGTEGNDIA